mmetsp:Transcript_57157/g.90593  ORF Transcript_57157/g.90593 Transcript_57157/m.90593 type:complete len:639 (-) Transcript_57157:13-1929(-)
MQFVLRFVAVVSSVLSRTSLGLLHIAEEVRHAGGQCRDAELLESSRSLLQKAVRSSEKVEAALEVDEQAIQDPESSSLPLPEDSIAGNTSSTLSTSSSSSGSSDLASTSRTTTSTSLSQPSTSKATTTIGVSTTSTSTAVTTTIQATTIAEAPSTSIATTTLTTITTTTTQASTSSNTSPPSNCSGYLAQGKCWYLSDRGESCSATCARNNRSFSFVLADKEEPIMPNLLSRSMEGGKLQSWAALECYNENEDQWHPANEDAAKQYLSNIGDWTNADCRLACPCAEDTTCKWRQPPACAPEFEWKGMWYAGCTSVDHDQPWCQHHHQHTDNNVSSADDWSNCLYSCGPDTGVYAQEDGCEWKPASTCVSEFDYEGTHYVGCTAADHHTPWCSNTDPYAGSWAHCSYGCLNSTNSMSDQAAVSSVPSSNSTDTVEKLNDVKGKDATLCYWQPQPECSRSFSYKGVDYLGCTDEDHPTPWCSLDRVHRGSFSVCTRVCNTSAASAASPDVATTTTTSSTTSAAKEITTTRTTTSLMMTIEQKKPCDKQDSENDGVGQAATLDEAGYQITAVADSPINMKRFVCRVADKIDCEVTNLAALYGFVLYYSGSVSNQTYQSLEDELKTLCLTDGKWLQAKPGYE